MLKALPVRVVQTLLFTLSLALLGSSAVAQPKPRIERAADLPRFSYKIEGKVEDVVRSPERFAPFAAAVRRDAESVLANYDIADKAAQRSLIGLLASLDYLEGRYDSRPGPRRAGPCPAGQAGRQAHLRPAPESDGDQRQGQRPERRCVPARRRRTGRTRAGAVALCSGRERHQGRQSSSRADRRSADLRADPRGDAAHRRPERLAQLRFRARRGQRPFCLAGRAAAQADLRRGLHRLPGRAPDEEGRHLGRPRRHPQAGRRQGAGGHRGLGQRRRDVQLPRPAGQGRRQSQP